MKPDVLPTLKQLLLVEQFPDDELCFEILWKNYSARMQTCPRCHKKARFYRVSSRKSYSCAFCGVHLSPAANTIFHRSHTPLTKWFLAIKLIYQSQGKVPALELKRRLSVTYKTAWRIKYLICQELNLRRGQSYMYSSATKPIPPQKEKAH
jgi:hypothetical protein